MVARGVVGGEDGGPMLGLGLGPTWAGARHILRSPDRGCRAHRGCPRQGPLQHALMMAPGLRWRGRCPCRWGLRLRRLRQELGVLVRPVSIGMGWGLVFKPLWSGLTELRPRIKKRLCLVMKANNYQHPLNVSSRTRRGRGKF